MKRPLLHIRYYYRLRRVATEIHPERDYFRINEDLCDWDVPDINSYLLDWFD